MAKTLPHRAPARRSQSAADVPVPDGDRLLEETRSTHCSDAGNASRFAHDYAAHLRYAQGLGWFVYADGVWRPDSTGEVMRAAQKTVSRIYYEAGCASDETKRRCLAAWALASESEPRLRAMVSLACSARELAIAAGALDANPWLLNCRNGTINLKTGRLQPHDPADLLTKMTAAAFIPDATSPLWQKVLKEALPDPTVRDYLQRVAGYTACGVTGADIFVLLFGLTRTAKGTIQEAIASALGDYAITAELDLLAERDRSGGPRPELVRLRGARMISIYETSRRLKLSASLVKSLAGSDPITARDLHARPITFTPQGTLWVATNYQPHAPADDAALWERIREIPFEHQIPEDRRDPKVRAKLRDPAHSGAAVLAWVVAGCLAWQKHGLTPPRAVHAATAAYQATQDPARHVRRYLEDCYAVLPTGWVATDELRSGYPAWAQDHEAPAEIEDARWTEALRAVGCTPARKPASRGWLGLCRRPLEAESPP